MPETGMTSMPYGVVVKKVDFEFRQTCIWLLVLPLLGNIVSSFWVSVSLPTK